MGNVYVVHCIDAEGPLYQDFSVPFDMLKNTLGIEIEPSTENLRKLQNSEIDLGGLEKDAALIVDANRISTKGTWEEIEQTLNVITTDDYRHILSDFSGGGWCYSWFCMDHVGFTGKNPRRRDAGYHKVFDRYRAITTEQNRGDIVQFHYHPVAFSGNFNDSGIEYWGSSNLNDILNRRLIDRNWFPTAFRPGFHTERPDSHWFLEQWIPFDYGNQSYDEESGQADMSNGRFGDWRHAPEEWRPYHPSHDDYRRKGICHRWITRCLNMYARVRQLEKRHVQGAFEEACGGRNVILAFTNHDYKAIEFEIERVRNLLAEVSEEFRCVPFFYVDAITAYRECLGLKPEKSGLMAEITEKNRNAVLTVTAENSIFGPQPYLALKTSGGRYHWGNFDFVSDNKWAYVFDNNTVYFDDITDIGIAANNAYGACEVLRFSKGRGDRFKKIFYNDGFQATIIDV